MDAGRRSFLKTIAVAAPAVILTPGLLMKIKPREIIVPEPAPILTGAVGGVERFSIMPRRMTLAFSGDRMSTFEVGDTVRVTASHVMGGEDFDAVITEKHAQMLSDGRLTHEVRAEQVENSAAEKKALNLDESRKVGIRNYSLTMEHERFISMDCEWQANGAYSPVRSIT